MVILSFYIISSSLEFPNFPHLGDAGAGDGPIWKTLVEAEGN